MSLNIYGFPKLKIKGMSTVLFKDILKERLFYKDILVMLSKNWLCYVEIVLQLELK